MSNGPFDIDVDTLGNLRPISKVVLSLGSNMGDSPVILQEAVDYLADTPDLIIVDVSPVYQTKPFGDIQEQDDFLNLVVVAESTLEPLTILDRAQAIEENFGRTREERHGPRTLDIDIIMVGKRISEDNIELPHPAAHERAFVLVPWHDIDPNGEIAGHGRIADLLDEVDTSTVTLREDVVIQANTGF
ncbi:2-amino-4-hydroxy-6-hydroxymethyldihydropteridine diphosphokinase [Tessaracoccus flavus]|jgi:2-amino-4-hydroxy-6-hydroxymethyldihydropteridine diphosphokinase|uniref:2-amino-4-hydroxy-6-hydroxymethyldihydropteridine diphosphokinase n=1 Tax=Tessaracoccus flavus TaxID=1610493 RepID=A0A1Q2CC34_9ACTN|nr:2-amino-4-hydroxy-6-hydroxymethyldihydropteridine diphosphokinase [Tessaracoccus flavus]AQP43662.1 2-amino-4-hydroxy-6-hydroxymethyldihydropteridine diphosphokinase [Tessaracoccus flavus]SDZ02165.1 2-amino-4-hydroxy-6-hydroxymethyldihydropteridinediphosphokinase [Tessaracoccus flavus]